LAQRLFWLGVGLAPLAVLVVLFGSSTGTLRIAVTFSVLSIVALAVSIAMRPSVELLRVDIEHRFLDEVERVRAHSREEVSSAARNTHRALSEQIRMLSDTVEWLRTQLDEVQASAMLAGPADVAGPGVRHTETVHVTRRTTTVGADQRGTVYGSPAAIERVDRPAIGYEETRREDRRHDELRYDDRGSHRDEYGHRREADYGSRRDDDRYDERPEYRGSRREDDRGSHDDDRAPRRDDDRYRDDDRGPRREDDRYRDDDRGSRREDDRYRDDDRGSRREDDRRRDDYGSRREDERRDDGRWEASGDRWASVRADDRGRELRIGERRTSVRSDDRGTEYRVEDRWAALRRDDEPAHGETDWESTFRSLSSGGSRPAPIAALPPSRGESTSRYLDEDRDDAPRSRGRIREAERDRTYDGDRSGHAHGREHDHREDRDERGGRDHGPDRARDYDRGQGNDRGRDYDRDYSGHDSDYGRDRDRDSRSDYGRDVPRQRGPYDDYR
jgi:hypothetical protein